MPCWKRGKQDLLVATTASGWPTLPVLGGTLTLLSSSENLLASEVCGNLRYGAFALFSFTPIGLGVWLVGGVVMVLLADRCLPDRGRNDDDLTADLASSGQLTVVRIPAGSELIGQSLHPAAYSEATPCYSAPARVSSAGSAARPT